MNARGPHAWCAAAWLLATGCAGGTGAVDLKTLPAAPVAILYRDEALAMDRIDTITDLKKRNQPSDKEGVVRVETLDGMFGGTPDAQRRLRDLAGHFALFDPHSGEVKVVEGVPPGAQPLAWSPDRTQLLLRGRFREGVQLFRWERASGEVEIVTSGPSDHLMGCIGPGGRLVAVEARRIGGRHEGRLLATPAGSATGLRPVTPGPSDVLPACSPNSSLIAYVTAGDDGLLTVAVRDLDTPSEAPRMIGRGTDPVFTPDGAWIVYAATGKQGTRLVRVRPDGSGRTPIGAGTEDESDPAVSPDGGYVAYVGQDDDERERLRVRRFDGTGDRPFLTSGDADAPVW
jgi:dipeptidyl aminopeptidase/acylaminoacyl peptidase